MTILSYKGQFLTTFLLERNIRFLKNLEDEYILQDYKVIFSPLEYNDKLFSNFKGFTFYHCKNGLLCKEILFETVGEFTNEFDIFILQFTPA